MKGFERKDLLFSLCGLNCGLCPMKLDGYCPGCGGGVGNQSCKTARCSMEHGGPTYCTDCAAYPCEKYEKIDEYDSFITHRRQKADLEKAARIGIPAYHAEQEEKAELLRMLLARYNDGRRKSFFYTAANLLELPELRDAVRQAESAPGFADMAQKEKSALVAEELRRAAERSGTELKLRRKKKG